MTPAPPFEQALAREAAIHAVIEPGARAAAPGGPGGGDLLRRVQASAPD